MGKKLFVGNLSFSMTDDALKKHFEAAGAVESAKIIIDKATGRSKGFGFVEMMDDSSAQTAISQFHGQELQGRPLTVSEAKPQAPREDRGPRSGGGGGRSGGFGGGGGGRSGGFGGGGGGGRGGGGHRF